MSATNPINPTNATNPIASYFSAKPEIVAAYLFGSQAAGTQRAFSDVDIALIADPEQVDTVVQNRHRYLLDLSRKLRQDVHLVVLNRAGETLTAQVLKKGRCLVVNDRRRLALFNMRALTQIADFGYHREKMQAGFLRNIENG